MQQLRFLQRNFTTELKTLQEQDKYVTTPEKLRDFEDRVNHYTSDGWRFVSAIPTEINGAACPIIILVRDGEL